MELYAGIDLHSNNSVLSVLDENDRVVYANFASYARTVGSRRETNGKKKGEGNAKCGNKHLAWAFIEAAHFAVRYDAAIKRW